MSLYISTYNIEDINYLSKSQDWLESRVILFQDNLLMEDIIKTCQSKEGIQFYISSLLERVGKIKISIVKRS